MVTGGFITGGLGTGDGRGVVSLGNFGGTAAAFGASAVVLFSSVSSVAWPFISFSRYWILIKAMAGLPPLVKTYKPSAALSISVTIRLKLSRVSVSGTILSIGTLIPPIAIFQPNRGVPIRQLKRVCVGN
jgi:hypothetical protein